MKSWLGSKILVLVIFLQFVNFCVSVTNCDSPAKTPEDRLKKQLLCTNNYDKDVQPSSDANNATIVKLFMIIKHFDYYDYRDALSITSWMSMKWRDDRLKWNARDFNDIKSVAIHSTEIWKPELTVFHTQSTQQEEVCKNVDCIVESDGQVNCIPPCNHEGKCDLNYINWPYDDHMCAFTVGTWMQTGSQIQITSEKITMLRKSQKHNKWTIYALKAEHLMANYTWALNKAFPTIKYTLGVQRHASSIESFIVAPALILASLNLIVLWLNPGCLERVILEVVALSAHFSFLQLMSWSVPKNGDVVPKALMFFRDSLIISGFLILDTVIKKAVLITESDTPSWIKSTTQTLRGNKIGQLVLTHPYLMNTDSFGRAILVNEDASGTPVEELPQKTTQDREKRASWSIFVRVWDILTFLILATLYMSMILSWIPNSKELPKTFGKDVVIETED